MIAAAWIAGDPDAAASRAVARALADGRAPSSAPTTHADFSFWHGEHQPGRMSATAILGRIDNAPEIADKLERPPGTALPELYDHALARWGDDADLHLVGHYCAITIEGPRRLRLVRSPWTAPPLHFAVRKDRLVASPLLTALFASGIEKRIDWDYLADQLAYDHHDCEPRGWYREIGRVPLGSRVRCEGEDWRLERYYDPVAIAPVRFGRDEDYVERANELLGEAAHKALAGVERPAIMLSGGLDSPLAASALLRRLPESARLHSFTFGPLDSWDGYAPPGTFGDERERVRRFAALHPRLVPHFPDPEAGGHDHRLRDVLARTEVPSANVANIGIFHALFEAAKAQGCDALFTALHGNFNISLDADWAAAEALRRGKLSRLASLLADAPEWEGGSAGRRLLSSAVLPNLPRRLQDAVRRLFHPERFAAVPPGSLLSPHAAAQWRERVKARRDGEAQDFAPVPARREDAIRAMWASANSAEDLDLGMERLHSIAHRDITAYRPLFEFCHGLPTEQLRRGGTDRYLARRMARGIMPEEQRLEMRQGRHNADWHARLSRRREALLAQAEAIRAHRQLSGILDIDRLQALLRDWPERTPVEWSERIAREMGITRALTAATFVSHAEKRNDF